MIRPAGEGKLEVSYCWFRIWTDAESFCFGSLRPDPPGPPNGPPLDSGILVHDPSAGLIQMQGLVGGYRAVKGSPLTDKIVSSNCVPNRLSVSPINCRTNLLIGRKCEDWTNLTVSREQKIFLQPLHLKPSLIRALGRRREKRPRRSPPPARPDLQIIWFEIPKERYRS